MDQSGALLGFSLRDTLTRLIPGLVFLSPIVIGVKVFSPSLLPNGTIFYIFLGLSAYLIGEFIDQLRSGLFRVPMSFHYFVYKETDQLEKMPDWYISIISFQNKLPKGVDFYVDREDDSRLTNQLDLNFREDIESELGIDFVNNRPREIYDLLLIYLDGDITPRLRRLQSVSMFSTNLRIASGGTLLLCTSYAMVNWKDPFFWSIWGVSLLISLLVILFWAILTTAHYQYIELLFKQYYLKRLEEQRG